MKAHNDWIGEWEYMPGGAFWAELEGRHVWYMVARDGGQYLFVPPKDVARGTSRKPWELYHRVAADYTWVELCKYQPEEGLTPRPFWWAEDKIAMHECVFGWHKPKELRHA